MIKLIRLSCAVTLLIAFICTFVAKLACAETSYSFKRQFEVTHNGILKNVGISSDGRFIVSCGEDAIIRNAHTGKYITKLVDNTGYIVSISFSSDGRWVATGSYDEDGVPGSVILWDAHTWKRKAVLHYDKGIDKVEFSPDSQYLTAVSASDYGQNYVWVWSTKSFNATHHDPVFQRISYYRNFAYSPDSKYLLLAGKQQTFIYEIKTGKRISSTSISNDPTRIYWGNMKKFYVVTTHCIKSVDVKNGQPDIRIFIPGAIASSSIISGTSNMIITGYYEPDTHTISQWVPGPFISIWNYRTGECIIYKRLQTSPDFTALSANGAMVITGGEDEYDTGSVTCWHLIRN